MRLVYIRIVDKHVCRKYSVCVLLHVVAIDMAVDSMADRWPAVLLGLSLACVSGCRMFK